MSGSKQSLITRTGALARIVANAMARDASWDAAVPEYLKAYLQAMGSVQYRSGGAAK